jgi:uncharacterized protein
VTLFLLFFFFFYGGMHLYAFMKAHAALALGANTSVLLMIFMFMMVASPFIIRFLEKVGAESAAKIMAYIGYTWFGVLFLFFSYSLATDIGRMVVFAAEHLLRRRIPFVTLSAEHAFFLSLSLSLLTSCYGYFEARNIRTERITIKSQKIPVGMGTLRIVQISDVHLGLLVREDRLKKILDTVKDARPDILVSTGDLVDGQVCRVNGLSDLLNEIRPRLGKFAITGNHEFYAGFDQAKCFTEDAGFRLLRGEAVTVADIINIVGVDDPAGRILKGSLPVSEKNLLAGIPRDKFTLFLKHRPLLDDESIGLFDLQLSGHVHKGQIFPFSIVTWLYYPVQAGFASVSKDSFLYVSRGAGTWGPPIRFLAPPEIAIIDLAHKDI